MRAVLIRIVWLAAAVATLNTVLSSCASTEKTQPAPSIGVATMLPDGTINLRLRAEVNSAVGDAVIQIKPSDPRYQEMLIHLGGLRSGEEKQVPPWKTPQLKNQASSLWARADMAKLRPNLSLERTAASWPRCAHQVIIAARGQLSSDPQLQR